MALDDVKRFGRSMNLGLLLRERLPGDQKFGDPLSRQPEVAWSVVSGAGTIDRAGLYTAPAPAGTAQVQAAAR